MPTIDSIKINNTIYDLRDNSINDSFGDIILPIQNLYNPENVTSGAYIKSTGDMILSNKYSYYTDFIPVLPNTTYTASTGLQVYCSEYSSNNLSSVITDSAGTQRRSLDVKGTFTTTSNTHYVCFTALQRPFPSNFTFFLGNK